MTPANRRKTLVEIASDLKRLKNREGKLVEPWNKVLTKIEDAIELIDAAKP